MPEIPKKEFEEMLVGRTVVSYALNTDNSIFRGAVLVLDKPAFGDCHVLDIWFNIAFFTTSESGAGNHASCGFSKHKFRGNEELTEHFRDNDPCGKPVLNVLSQVYDYDFKLESTKPIKKHLISIPSAKYNF